MRKIVYVSFVDTRYLDSVEKNAIIILGATY